MKHILTILKCFTAITIASLVTNCATTHTGQFDGSVAIHAGFKPVTATTPEQKTTLAKMPPNQVSAVTHKGKKYYVIPNAARNQAYIGGPKQFQRYQELQSANQIGNANVTAIELEGTGYDNMGAGSQAAWDGWLE